MAVFWKAAAVKESRASPIIVAGNPPISSWCLALLQYATYE